MTYQEKSRALKKRLGWAIREARLDTHTTQVQLARMAKTKQPAIARAERNGCDFDLALKCLHAMGFTLDSNNMRAADPFKSGLTFSSCPV